MRRTFSLLFVIASAVMGLLALTASSALAHNSLRSSSPADSTVLVASPATWTIRFDKPVPLESASGSVVNGDGSRTALSNPRHGAKDTVIVFDFPANLAGAITARWRLVSTDGHVISGRVTFTVNPGVTTTAAGATPESADTSTTVAPSVDQSSNSASSVDTTDERDSTGGSEPVRVALRLANYLALVLLGGIVFIDIDIASGAITSSRGRRFARLGALGATAVPAIQFLMFVGDVQSPGRSFGSTVSAALSMTPGAMLVLRAITGGVIVALLGEPLRRGRFARREQGLFAVLSMVYLVTLSYVGHSRSQNLPWLGIPVDVAHTAAIAVWLGGLAAMVAVVVPLVDEGSAVVAFRRFSFAAQRAVAVIVATGVVQTIRLHGGGSSLVTSAHGLLILAKVAVVGVMVLLAARNRRILLDRRSTIPQFAGRTRQLVVSATMNEVLFGAVVIVITAVLVAVTPG